MTSHSSTSWMKAYGNLYRAIMKCPCLSRRDPAYLIKTQSRHISTISKRKLQQDERYKENYVKFMEDVTERGDAEQIKDNGKEGEKWFIPHRGVYHDKKPDKVRVVFDCSARYKGTSPNDHLLSGPDMLNNLNGVLIRFHLHPVALMCNTEGMFHQFHVDEADCDYLRSLWWNQGDLNSQPCKFCIKVHLFSAASSTGCANYGLKHFFIF